MDCIVHRVAKSWTQLSDFDFTSPYVHCRTICNSWDVEAMAPDSSTPAWETPWTRSLIGCSPRGRTESDTTEETQQQQDMEAT